MDDIKLFAKKGKKNGDTNTNKKNIQPGYRNRIWHRKCAMLIIKRGITDGIEEPDQVRISSLEKRRTTSTWEYWKGTPSRMRRYKKK